MSERHFPLSKLVSNIVDNRGRTCPTSETGIPLIATNCIKNESLYPEKDKLRYVSRATYDEWFRDHPKPGDIIFVNKGTPGRVCLVPDPVDFCIAQDMVALRANEHLIYPNYLFALLRSPQTQAAITNLHVGTMIPHFKKTDFDKLILPVPDRSAQIQIGDLYVEFCKAIHILEKTNETLEAIAKAIFKSWFVDYDPVRAKAEGRPTGLPKEISDLFPDSFEDSELGEIPKGWRLGDLSTLATLNPESWGNSNNPRKLRYLDLSNVKFGKISKIEEYTWDDAPSRARRILRNGDTIVGTVRPGNGSYCLISEDGLTGSTGFAVLRPKDLSAREYVYLAVTNSINIERLANLSDGGAYPAVRPDVVLATPCCLFSDNILTAFSDLLLPLYNSISMNEIETGYLSSLRDTLLPKLISGEQRIPDAEALVTEAGL